MTSEKRYTLEITESERKILILFLRHIQECPYITRGKGYSPMAFMLSNKLFGRGYKEGDWEKMLFEEVKKQIPKFEPKWAKRIK